MNVIIINKIQKVNIIGLGSRNKASCPYMGLGPMREMPSWRIFLRDPSPYLREPRKTPNG